MANEEIRINLHEDWEGDWSLDITKGDNLFTEDELLVVVIEMAKKLNASVHVYDYPERYGAPGQTRSRETVVYPVQQEPVYHYQLAPWEEEN